jgi:hypothetical protein
MWVFLTNSKDPPFNLIDKLLREFGHWDGGSICTDQGVELAGSPDLRDMVLRTYN